ncbi:hypothetical protein L0F63_006385, partial [Massospora cicadina]
GTHQQPASGDHNNYKVVQPVSPEQHKEVKMARKAAYKAKPKKQKEEKEAVALEKVAKRNIEQQQEHLSSITAPKTAKKLQDNEQWTSNQKWTTHTSYLYTMEPNPFKYQSKGPFHIPT